MTVTETLFTLDVGDMARATNFYATTVGATTAFASPRFTSLFVAGVRVGLFLNPKHVPSRTGLHFVVSPLDEAMAVVQRAGGSVQAPIQAAPGVIIAEATDTEGNTFTFRAG